MKGLLLQPSVGSATNGRLLAAGPLTKQPGSQPYRKVLLLDHDGGFTVHTEGFSGDMLPAAVEPGSVKSHLFWGHYFPKDELVKAVQHFADTVEKDAGHLESLYRETV